MKEERVRGGKKGELVREGVLRCSFCVSGSDAEREYNTRRFITVSARAIFVTGRGLECVCVFRICSKM